MAQQIANIRLRIIPLKHWKKIARVLKWFLGIGLLVVSFQGMNFSYLIHQLASMENIWFFLAVGGILFGLLLKLLRWGYFLHNYQLKCTPLQIAQAFFLGQAANILLPVRGGELVRLSWLLPNSTWGATEVAASILLEKYLDLLALLMFIFQVLLYLPVEHAARARHFLAPMGLLATFFLFIIVMTGPEVWGRLRKKFLHPTNTRFELALKRVDQLLENSRWLRRVDRLVISIGLTILIWIVMLSTNLFLFRALHITQGVEAGCLVLVLIYLGLFPSIMPGNMGPFYFFAQLALKPFAVPEAQSVTFSVVLHLITTLPPVALGGLLLLLAGRRPVIAPSILPQWKRLSNE